MMELEEIKETVKSIIVGELGTNIKPNEIQDDISLYDDGIGLDSIAIVDLIVSIEKKFGFDFDESEISGHLFSSINNLAEHISKRCSN